MRHWDYNSEQKGRNLCPLGVNILVGGKMISQINEKIDHIPYGDESPRKNEGEKNK